MAMKKLCLLLLLLVIVMHMVSSVSASSQPEHGDTINGSARRLLGRPRWARSGPCATHKDGAECKKLREKAECQRKLYMITREWAQHDSTQFWKSTRTHGVVFSPECCHVVSTFDEYYRDHAYHKILFNPAAVSLIEGSCFRAKS